MNHEDYFGSRLADALRSPVANALCSGALAALWLGFAYAHFQAFLLTHQVYLVLIFASETLTAFFYIARRIPETVSVRLSDWLLAASGTFLPLLLRPDTQPLFEWASYLMGVGVLLQILGMLSLNRSFAIVAAKRTIKTNFMYRWVRHPIYASYLIILSSYVLVNASWENLLIFALTLGCLVGRILREEAHLSADTAYLDYMQRVRYRLVPLVF